MEQYLCRYVSAASNQWVLGPGIPFAGKEQMLTEELVMRLAYLSGYEKAFNESLYRAMAMGCEAFPSDDTVEAICKYIMKGNPRKPEYFQWFSAAVDRGIRITRLYEYYVETLDTSYRRVLPKPLLMYFTYNNNTLGDSKRAYLYACIIAGRNVIHRHTKVIVKAWRNLLSVSCGKAG